MNFSRTCWMTFHWRGISSSVSVTSSPILRNVVPPQHAQAVGAPARRSARVADAGQRPASRPAPFERSHHHLLSRRPDCHLGHGLCLRRIRLEIDKLQLELVEQRTTFRGLARTDRVESSFSRS